MGVNPAGGNAADAAQPQTNAPELVGDKVNYGSAVSYIVKPAEGTPKANTAGTEATVSSSGKLPAAPVNPS